MNTTAATASLTPGEKRTLLTKLLAEQVNKSKMCPLSHAQSRLWFLDQLQPGEPVYNIPIPIPLNGFIDAEILQRSVNEIIRRHEALRTTIQLVDQKPVQVIAPTLDINIPLVTLDSAEPPEVEANRLVLQEGRRSFDLAKGPLIRATILKLDPNRHILLVVMHHIVSDGWSMGVFFRELSALYSAYSLNQPSPLQELPIQYADYTKWQAEWLSSNVLDEQLAYWQSKLAGLKQKLELPLDHLRPRVQTHRGATEAFVIESAVLEELNALSKRESATLFMTILAAFQTLLYRYTGETDFAIGSPIANRTRPEMEGLIGFFVNTIVLRAKLSPELSFRELLHSVRQTTLEAYEHQDLPFEKLIEEIRPVRDTSHNPLFQVMLTVHHAGDATTVDGSASGLISNGTAKFDLTAVIVEAGDRAQGFLEYNSDLFDQDTILTMLDRFHILLTSIIQDPDTELCALRLATAVETATNESEIADVRTISTLIAAYAIEQPEATAFVCGESRITYSEFDFLVNRHAKNLASQGVQSGDHVACQKERSVEQATAIIGALRLGAICVPLDSDEPPPRLAQMLADVQARPVITSKASQPKQTDDEAPATACLVYRSGSDGHPVGIQLTQYMLCRSKLASNIRIKSSDRVAWHSGFAKDAGINELFGSLSAGASIVTFHNPQTPLQFARTLREHEITVLFVSCGLLKRLSQEFYWSLRSARLIFTYGESLSSLEDLRNTLGSNILQRVFVLNGWTEAGGASAFFPISELNELAPALPIGYAIAGSHLDVLDDHGKSVPPGIVGEIAASGYRTGDFATQTANGYIEFRGRRDDRIHISGVRVEAAEIEATLIQHKKITCAAAVASRSPKPSGLVVFVTSQDSIGTSQVELQNYLNDSLPPELIPESIHTVKQFPLTKEGKIDRVALRANISVDYAGGASAVPYVAPQNDIEEQISRIWEQTLGNDHIGVHDNFFSHGGHSLLATQLIARMSDHFGVNLPLRTLFEKPTITELAEEFAKEELTHSSPSERTISQIPRDRQIPLSFAQQRLWFLDQYEPDSAFYIMPNASRLQGSLDAGALCDSINALVQRHESLRTTFDATDGQPLQIIHPSLNIDVPIHDLQHLSQESQKIESQRLANQEAQLPFDLVRGPLIRAQLLKTAPDDHILLLTIHHIIADGWSMEVLFRELGVFYAALSIGQDPVLPDLVVQYADFACWQRKWLSGSVLASQLEYWKQQLKDAPPVLELHTDRPRPRIQVFRGGMHTFSLPLSLVTRLRALCEMEQVTLFMALLGGFKAMLYRYTGLTDLVVGTPVANRVRPELEGLIGFFANTLVLRTNVLGEMSFREVLREIKKTTSGAYANQDMPFEKLVEELAPERNLGYNPLFQVMFTLQNTGRVPLPDGTLDGAVSPALGTGVAKFDLTAFLSETSNGIEVGFEYNSSLFDLETVERMGRHFAMLLSAAVDDSERSVETLPIFSERDFLDLEDWNATAVPIADRTIHEMFEAQVSHMPDAVAIAVINDSSEEILTYSELNEIANGWAHRLRSLGVKPDACVGIHMSRSISMITAVLAVLKAGGAYVPLDPNYPAERLAFMAKDACLPLVLSERALVGELECPGAQVLLFNGDDVPQPRSDNPAAHAHIDCLAYVIYTSGSTGKPKGVAMPHRPLVNLLHWQNLRSNLPLGATTLQFASLNFDVSFQEIFSTLTSGGKLHLISEDQRIDPDSMWDVIERAAICRIFLPFVALLQLAEAAERRAHIGSNLREVITAGEQLKITPAIVRLAERAGFELYNQYGPTETHVTTEFKLTGPPSSWSSLPPIGKPIANTSIYILDGKYQSVPVGVPGEIYIGGTPLARGYLHNPELTMEKFITGYAASPDMRLYRTGDRGRYQEAGAIEFLGRMDTQVKIRGVRVEPEEIENTLQRHPSVRTAAVMACFDGTHAPRLIAYVQLHSDLKTCIQELRDHLAAWLPDHMIPAVITPIETMPLTPSGKIDRNALQDPDSILVMPQSTQFTPPQTPVELVLVDIWRELLQMERIGIHDNFFELGGHSLLATRVMSRIREELDVDLPVRQLFENPFISDLAVSIVHGAVEQDEDVENLLREIENISEGSTTTGRTRA
jgi:amino acid adenylation domain-containing protein